MGITEEGSGSEHGRRTFHDEPGDHSVHLVLSVPTAIDNRSTHLDLSVTVEPLLVPTVAMDATRGEATGLRVE